MAGAWGLGLRYLAAVVGVALLRGLYGLYRTREKAFLLLPLYGFLHLLCILPVQLYALCTLRNNGWGTRSPGRAADYAARSPRDPEEDRRRRGQPSGAPARPPDPVLPPA